jgi:hypothetical protein
MANEGEMSFEQFKMNIKSRYNDNIFDEINSSLNMSFSAYGIQKDSPIIGKVYSKVFQSLEENVTPDTILKDSSNIINIANNIAKEIINKEKSSNLDYQKDTILTNAEISKGNKIFNDILNEEEFHNNPMKYLQNLSEKDLSAFTSTLVGNIWGNSQNAQLLNGMLYEFFKNPKNTKNAEPIKNFFKITDFNEKQLNEFVEVLTLFSKFEGNNPKSKNFSDFTEYLETQEGLNISRIDPEVVENIQNNIFNKSPEERKNYLDNFKNELEQSTYSYNDSKDAKIIQNTFKKSPEEPKNEKLASIFEMQEDFANSTISIPENTPQNRNTTYALLYSAFLEENSNIAIEDKHSAFENYLKAKGIEVTPEDKDILSDLEAMSADDISKYIDSLMPLQISTVDIDVDKLYTSMQEVFQNITKKQFLTIISKLATNDNYKNTIEKLPPELQDYADQLSEYIEKEINDTSKQDSQQYEEFNEDIFSEQEQFNNLEEISEDIFSEQEQFNNLEEISEDIFSEQEQEQSQDNDAPLTEDSTVNIEDNSKNVVSFIQSQMQQDEKETQITTEHSEEIEDEIPVEQKQQQAESVVEEITEEQEHQQQDESVVEEITDKQEVNENYSNSTALVPQGNRFIRAIKNFFANIGKPKPKLITDGREETKAKKTYASFNSFEFRSSLRETIRKIGDLTIGNIAKLSKSQTVPNVNTPGLQGKVTDGTKKEDYDKLSNPNIKENPTLINTINKYTVENRNSNIEFKALQALNEHHDKNNNKTNIADKANKTDKTESKNNEKNSYDEQTL